MAKTSLGYGNYITINWKSIRFTASVVVKNKKSARKHRRESCRSESNPCTCDHNLEMTCNKKSVEEVIALE